MAKGQNGSGSVTNKQLYEALLGMETRVMKEITDVRVIVAALPCQQHKERIEKLEVTAKPRVNWKGVSAFATTLALLLGLDKAWDMFAHWFQIVEAAR